ncbi:MAG TPA: ATP-binding protein [Saprospiraceae bacterium]|nr:ATP-binding protein [Saprospiraceae bacterium]
MSVTFLLWGMVLVGLSSFLLIRYGVGQILYRRVKILYKLISETKWSDKSKSDVKLGDSEYLNNVEQDVERYIARKNLEMDHLLQMEQYRKDYIGNVSHELKTPVFNIQGYLQTLIDGAMDDPEVRANFLEKAYKNALRLQSIIEDLSIVHKLESGRQVLDMDTFDMKELVEEVFDENSPIAEKKNIKIRFKLGADETHLVTADKEHIRIVLNNLINNAIKYGKVSGYCKVSLYDMEDSVLAEVSDNGIGIPEEHLKHVFDRFYRVDKSRSREQGGSGLGLSIVKHILEAHGQNLHVRSKVGIGTTFGFTLKKAR